MMVALRAWELVWPRCAGSIGWRGFWPRLFSPRVHSPTGVRSLSSGAALVVGNGRESMKAA